MLGAFQENRSLGTQWNCYTGRNGCTTDGFKMLRDGGTGWKGGLVVTALDWNPGHLDSLLGTAPTSCVT